MKTYIIRITTIDNLYADYIVEAKDIREASLRVKEGFFRDYPGADLNIKLSLIEPNKETILEIINAIKEVV